MDCGVTISDTPQKERVKTLSEACLDRSYCRVALRAPRNDADLSLPAEGKAIHNSKKPKIKLYF